MSYVIVKNCNQPNIMITALNLYLYLYNPEIFSLVLNRVTRMKVWIYFQNNFVIKENFLPILKIKRSITMTSWDHVPTTNLIRKC